MTEPRPHNDPARVIPLFEAAPQRLASELLAAGAGVVEAWGPEQMAVMSLTLQLDGVRVLFDSERGYTSVHLIVGDRRTYYPHAVYAWSRSLDADGRPRRPEHQLLVQDPDTYGPVGGRPESLAEVALWRDVLPWYRTADPGLLDTVERASRESWNLPHAERRPAAVRALFDRRVRAYLDAEHGLPA